MRSPGKDQIGSLLRISHGWNQSVAKARVSSEVQGTLPGPCSWKQKGGLKKA